MRLAQERTELQQAVQRLETSCATANEQLATMQARVES